MALQVVCRDGFLKGDPDFILVKNNNNPSIMHRFRYNQVLPLSRNDVTVKSPLGGAEGNSLGWILEGRPRLHISFGNVHTSIMHSFRFNQVFPLAGYDGTVLSP